MSSSNLLWIFTLLSLFDAILSSCDLRPPLLLSVGGDNSAARGGISLKVGTPPQTVAAVINAYVNTHGYTSL